MRTCAICGWRDAVDGTEWDGRLVPACGVCLEPADVPPGWLYEPTGELAGNRVGGTKLAIIQAVRVLGCATAGDIADQLGITERSAYDLITTTLMRMRRRGEIEADHAGIPGGHGRGGYVYTLPKIAEAA